MQIIGGNLSELAQENLRRNEEIRKSIEQKQNQSRWIRMGKDDPTVMVLKFDPEKCEFNEGEYKGRPTKQFQYTVTDPNDGFGVERILALSPTHTYELDGILAMGKNIIKVTREGMGTGTRYRFEAV